MIKVNLVSLRKEEKLTDENKRIRDFLEENNLLIPGNDYTLNLGRLTEEALVLTFSDLGIRDGDTCTVTSIAQKNCA